MNVRDEVQYRIEHALAPFGLEGYADGVMDSLDTVIDDWEEIE